MRILFVVNSKQINWKHSIRKNSYFLNSMTNWIWIDSLVNPLSKLLRIWSFSNTEKIDIELEIFDFWKPEQKHKNYCNCSKCVHSSNVFSWFFVIKMFNFLIMVSIFEYSDIFRQYQIPWSNWSFRHCVIQIWSHWQIIFINLIGKIYYSTSTFESLVSFRINHWSFFHTGRSTPMSIIIYKCLPPFRT